MGSPGIFSAVPRAGCRFQRSPGGGPPARSSQRIAPQPVDPGGREQPGPFLQIGVDALQGIPTGNAARSTPPVGPAAGFGCVERDQTAVPPRLAAAAIDAGE